MPSKGKRLAEVSKAYRERHPARIKERKRLAYLKNREKQLQKSRDFRKNNRESVLLYNKKYGRVYRAALRAEFLKEYGGRCSCCGETEPLFLQLDHVKNDGARHRKEQKTGAKILMEIKKLGWPKDYYRLLCANCNIGRHLNGGTCPHERA
jgi:hypothetical protein